MMFTNKKITKACLSFIFVLNSFSVFAQDDVDHKKIEEKIDKFLTYFSGNNPGAVVTVVKQGNVVFNKAYGLANSETGEKMQTDKAFNLAEISKAFNVMAVYKLIERNKLSLEDNLTSIFPDFPQYGSKVKVYNLLNHTSGLQKYDESVIQSNEEVYNYLTQQDDLLFEPDSKQQFSNSDYALLVKIIEKVSRKSYSKYMHKYVFKKLDLENTYIGKERDKVNIAEPHFKVDSIYEVRRTENNILGFQGIYSTAGDIVKMSEAFYTDDYLSQGSLKQIFTAKKLDFGSKESYYKYGWYVMEKNGVKYNWIGASCCGYSNLIFILPEMQTTVLILSNRNDAYDFLKLAIEIAKLYNKFLYMG